MCFCRLVFFSPPCRSGAKVQVQIIKTAQFVFIDAITFTQGSTTMQRRQQQEGKLNRKGVEGVHTGLTETLRGNKVFY